MASPKAFIHNLSLLFLGFVLACGVLANANAADSEEDDGVLMPVPSKFDEAPPVVVQVFALSKCSDFKDFEVFFKPIYDQLVPIVTLVVDYIVDVEPSSPLGFTSKHGETEVLGDIVELCVQSIASEKFYDFVQCVDVNQEAIPNNVEECAKQIGIDEEALDVCIASADGKTLLKQSSSAASEAGAKWSPTVFIGGKEFCKYKLDCFQAQGPDFVDAICKAYQGERKPYLCHQVGK